MHERTFIDSGKLWAAKTFWWEYFENISGVFKAIRLPLFPFEGWNFLFPLLKLPSHNFFCFVCNIFYMLISFSLVGLIRVVAARSSQAVFYCLENLRAGNEINLIGPKNLAIVIKESLRTRFSNRTHALYMFADPSKWLNACQPFPNCLCSQKKLESPSNIY